MTLVAKHILAFKLHKNVGIGPNWVALFCSPCPVTEMPTVCIRSDDGGGGFSQILKNIKIKRGEKAFEKAITQTRVTANTNRPLPNVSGHK